MFKPQNTSELKMDKSQNTSESKFASKKVKRPFDAEENHKESFNRRRKRYRLSEEENNKKLYDNEKELLRLCKDQLKKEKEKNTDIFKDMDKLLRSTNNMLSAKSMISTGNNTINRELKKLKALNEKYAITDEED